MYVLVKCTSSVLYIIAVFTSCSYYLYVLVVCSSNYLYVLAVYV